MTVLPVLADVARWIVGGWFVLVAVALIVRASGGGMAVRGMLLHRRGVRMDMRRAQNMVVTLVFAAGYLIAAMARDPAAGMPRVPGVLLMMLVGSQGTYLWGKFVTRND